MKAVVIGLGEVGQNITRTLSDEGHDVVCVDSNEQRVASLQDQLDALVVAGNGASPRFLEEVVEVGKAELLCAVTQVDEANVIAALAGRQLGAKRTVARVRDPQYFGTEDAFARDVMGIDFVIHPERATAEEILAAILLPGAVHVEYLAEGRIAVAESILSERSPLVGVPLAERKVKIPHFIFGAIREGQAKIAGGDERLEPGDHVLLAAARQNIAPAVAQIAGTTRRVEEVVLFGAGKIGYHLARLLEREDCRVMVMERDESRARFVAERLPRSLVLHEEGVSKEVLLLQNVDRAGAFIACAGDDRSNLLAALHAKQVGADLCVAVVSREEFVPLVSALKLDAAFSPRLITAGAILRFVRTGPLRSLHLLLGGSEVIEVQADEGSPAAESSALNADLPRGARVAAIDRGGKILFPLGGERIRPGDDVVVFGMQGSAAEVERAFEGNAHPAPRP